MAKWFARFKFLRLNRGEAVKTRKFYRDGIEQDIVGPIKTKITREGHTVEIYKTSDGNKNFFVTLSGSHWCAHGNSIADAIGSALWKDPKHRPSKEALVALIKKEGPSRKITLNEFRVLTGACLIGCKSALTKAGRDESPLTAKDIKNLVSKEWGEKLIDILGWEEVTS